VGTVFGADLDGDGSQEVVVGSDNFHYHAFAADGKLLWRTETVHLSTVGCAGDLDGDGRQDVVAGTLYYWPRLLGSDGKVLGGLSGGPVTSAVAATDLDGDGRAEALIGMEDCFVRALKPDRELLWEANVGGTPTAIVPLPGNEPRLAVSTDGFGVCFLDGQGHRIGYTRLPQAVSGLALVAPQPPKFGGQVGERLVAACADGQAYVLTLEGKVVGRCPLPARPESVVVLDDHHAAVACGSTLAVVSTTG
jgi:outer membrane protein assembly factor BamB